MATKKQLKKYARNLEALLYLNTPEELNDKLCIIVSDNVSIETKIEFSIDKLLSDYALHNSKVSSLILRRKSLLNKNLNI